MLTIQTKGSELYDDEKEIFVDVKPCTLVLEHSLISLSKWESFYKKPFLSTEKRSIEEQLQYIRFMSISKDVPDEAFSCLDNDSLQKIISYIDDPMTATTFYEYQKQGPQKKKETLTSEIIYWQMIALGIPWECQKWHLNRLITLIRVCNIKNNPKSPKMAINDRAKMMAELNAKRRAEMNTKG